MWRWLIRRGKGLGELRVPEYLRFFVGEKDDPVEVRQSKGKLAKRDTAAMKEYVLAVVLGLWVGWELSHDSGCNNT